MRRECRERFPHNRLQRKPLFSDPSMHHGTCVTHVPWCMSGSLTRGSGENVPGIPGACATRNFSYLARGLCCGRWKWQNDMLTDTIDVVLPITLFEKLNAQAMGCHGYSNAIVLYSSPQFMLVQAQTKTRHWYFSCLNRVWSCFSGIIKRRDLTLGRHSERRQSFL